MIDHSGAELLIKLSRDSFLVSKTGDICTALLLSCMLAKS
jgi:hypothetical protein